jgi:hypothetical protein
LKLGNIAFQDAKVGAHFRDLRRLATHFAKLGQHAGKLFGKEVQIDIRHFDRLSQAERSRHLPET